MDADGQPFAQAPDADDAIADHAQLDIEKRRHEMLLLRFVAGVFRENSLSPRSVARQVPCRAASERPGLDYPRPKEEMGGTYEVVIHSRSE
jgi:hypothetical protein